jgi:hypothetical protein
MKFRPIKRLADKEPNKVIEWIKNELNGVLRELFIGLDNLSFADNFETFLWEGSLAVNEVKQIVHPFRQAPSGYIIYKQIGNAVVDASTTDWTNEVVYLRNNSGANAVSLKVIFFL